MKIDLNNYEAFFLDYHEGRLDAVQAAKVMLFLEEHPELKEEFEEFEAFALDPEPVQEMPAKNSLLKSVQPIGAINEENYEDYFIGEAEDLLNASEKEDLAVFVATNPDLERDYKLYQHTTLKAGPVRAMPQKSNLKKSVLIPLWSPNVVRVAAAILLLIASGLFFLFSNSPSNTFGLTASKTVVVPNSPLVGIQQFAEHEFGPWQLETVEENIEELENEVLETSPANYASAPLEQFVATTESSNVLPDVPAIQQQENKVNQNILVHEQEPGLATVIPEKIEPEKISEIPTPEPEEEFLSIKELVAQKIRGKEAHEEMPQPQKNKIRAADLVNGLAKRLKRPFQVKESFDSNGELMAYEVSSKKVSISRNVRK